jgi:NO-binding membrane sensor protein with MHYT domain
MIITRTTRNMICELHWAGMTSIDISISRKIPIEQVREMIMDESKV